MNLDTILLIARFALGGALVASNIVVWYGVWLERDSAPKEVQHRGWRILVRGLAAEAAVGFVLFAVDTSISTRQSSEITAAQGRAADAEREAGLLGVDVTNLHIFVDHNEGEINKQLGNFQNFADQEKKDAGDIITSLNAEKREIIATIGAAQKDENALRASADTIRDLRKTIHDLTADRVLTKQQSDGLTKAANPLRHIEFDMAAALTSEAWSFARQIGTALQAAGWEWKPRPMFPAIGAKGVPDIGNDVREGLILEACKSDVAALDPFAGFVKNQLSTDGFSFTGSWYEDTDAVTKAEPCGRLHIIIGAKY